jgi:hypothetical protein
MIKDLVGLKFNRLTAIKFSHVDEDKKYAHFVFRCECGVEKTLPGSVVSRGYTKSCGCANEERLKSMGGQNRLPYGESAFNALLHNYKRAAERRGFPFELSPQKFKELTSQMCVYCGVAPQQVYKVKESSSYTYNGVDRKDNSLGYISSNVCACCIHCNRAKHVMPLEEFLGWLDRVTKFRNCESSALAEERIKP